MTHIRCTSRVARIGDAAIARICTRLRTCIGACVAVLACASVHAGVKAVAVGRTVHRIRLHMCRPSVPNVDVEFAAYKNGSNGRGAQPKLQSSLKRVGFNIIYGLSNTTHHPVRALDLTIIVGSPPSMARLSGHGGAKSTIGSRATPLLVM